MSYDLIVLGGGAAGIFAAIRFKEAHPDTSVLVLEKSGELLSKMRISGGGRCNITNATFDPKLLVQNYPRGHRELLGPFHHFGPRDTVDWFASQGVCLKTEADGRMFPTSDTSATIIHCLLESAKTAGVTIRTHQTIDTLSKTADGFQINGETTKRLLLATGSHPSGYRIAKNLGHTIQEPIPSLFTFHSPSSPLKPLSGLSAHATLHLENTPYTQTGPLLITHFGFSGPAILKLSAFAARHLHERNYRATLLIDWLPDHTEEALFDLLTAKSPLPLPKKLARALTTTPKLRTLARKLKSDPYPIDGKAKNKEEFVTCGGVTLQEVNFKTMESKLCPGLYFAGEILDIDALTGGFNFQNAFTTAFLAAKGAIGPQRDSDR